jgi:RecA-family ATPase
VCELPDPDENEQVCGPPVVREQRIVIGAHTGHGKTSLALQMVRAVVTGERFLDWQGCGGRALVIDVEQGLRTVKRRLREAGLAESDLVDYVRVPDGLELNCNPSHIAEIQRILTANQYVLVHMDPFYKLHVGDSNAEREVTDLMRQLDAWRSEYHFALSLAGHCRKPPQGAKFTMHEFFGSSAYLRGAEVVVGLQRLSDGYGRLHFFKDRDGDGPPIDTHWGLIFSREDGFRRDPSDGAPKRTAKTAVYDLLTQGGLMTEKELASASG